MSSKASPRRVGFHSFAAVLSVTPQRLTAIVNIRANLVHPDQGVVSWAQGLRLRRSGERCAFCVVGVV